MTILWRNKLSVFEKGKGPLKLQYMYRESLLESSVLKEVDRKINKFFNSIFSHTKRLEYLWFFFNLSNGEN